MLPSSQHSLPVQIAASFVPYLQPRHCFDALKVGSAAVAVAAEVSVTAVAAAAAAAPHLRTPQSQANRNTSSWEEQKAQDAKQRRGGRS